MKKRKAIRTIERLVKANNISFYKLAKDTGISLASICQWRDGRCEPKLAPLVKIADYFKVDIKDFIN